MHGFQITDDGRTGGQGRHRAPPHRIFANILKGAPALDFETLHPPLSSGLEEAIRGLLQSDPGYRWTLPQLAASPWVQGNDGFSSEWLPLRRGGAAVVPFSRPLSPSCA